MTFFQYYLYTTTTSITHMYPAVVVVDWRSFCCDMNNSAVSSSFILVELVQVVRFWMSLSDFVLWSDFINITQSCILNTSCLFNLLLVVFYSMV